MNLNECINELIKIEEKGYEIYEKTSQNSSERLKPVLETFASEELKHMKQLGVLLKNNDADSPDLDFSLTSSLENQKKHISSGLLNYASEKEFFKFALQLETNSVELYENLSKLFVSDPLACEVFSELIPEEKKHMIFILNVLHELK